MLMFPHLTFPLPHVSTSPTHVPHFPLVPCLSGVMQVVHSRQQTTPVDSPTTTPTIHGEKEKAALTRTFSPPPASTLNRAQRPEALILHQSEEALHYIDYSNSCDIGSAGSSHSSGFNESMFEMVLENTGKHFKQFDVDSPLASTTT
eukprot:sb/3473770/